MKTTIISGPRRDFFWRNLLLDAEEMPSGGRIWLLLEKPPTDADFRRRLVANGRSTAIESSYLAGGNFERAARHLVKGFETLEKCATNGKNFFFYFENPLRWLLRLDRTVHHQLRRALNRLASLATKQSSITLGVNSLTEYFQIFPRKTNLFGQADGAKLIKDHPTFILLPNDADPFYERIEKSYAVQTQGFASDELICLLNHRQVLTTTKKKWLNG